MTEKLVNNHLLSSSWKKEKVFKKLYSGGKVEYDSSTRTLYTLCDGCILVISIDKGPFIIGSIGPYDSEKTIGTEHSEEITTFGIFSESLINKNIVTIGPKGIFRLWKLSFEFENNGKKNVIKLADLMYVRSWKSCQLTTSEIEFDSTGQYVSTGGTDGSIQVYDAFGGFTTHIFKSHKSLITKLRFHGKRWLLFSSCVEGIIGVHDLTTSRLIVKVDSHYSVINSFDLFETSLDSLGGLVTTGADNMINIWDLDKLPESDKIGLLSNMANNNSDHILKNKKRKSDHGMNNNSDTVSFLPIKQIHSTETIFSIKCTNSNLYNFSDEKECNKCPWFIIAGNEKSGINIWNPINGKIIKSIIPKDYSLNESAILYMFLHKKSSDANNFDFDLDSFLILITEDRNIVIMEYPTFKLYTIMFGDIPDYIQLSLFLKNNENKLTEDKVEDDFLPIKKVSDNYLTDNPDKIINCIVMDSTETPKLLSINKSPHYTSSFIGHKSTVLTMDISNCCNYLATGGKDMTIKIWSIYNNECLSTLVGHTSMVTALSFQKKPFVSGNNSYFLFSASSDNTLKGWNIAGLFYKNKSKNNSKNILAIYNIVAHRKEINHINISHNDKMIATSSEDKTLKLWSFPELKQLGTCKGHSSGIWQSSFSPIEKIIATASSDGSIKVWNLNTFTCIKTLQGHDGSVLQVDFLGNGIQLLSCGVDGLVKLWNTNTGECIKTFFGHDEKIWTLNLLKEYESDSSNNQACCNSKLAKTRYMVTGGSDSQLIFWRDNTIEVGDEENFKNLKKMEDINKIDLLFSRKDYIDALNISLNQKMQHKTYLILEKLLKQTDDCSDSKNNILIYDDNNDIKANHSNLVDYSNLCAWIKNLSNSELSILFEFILEWITISKSVWLSNSLMYLVLTNVDSNDLYKVEGFSQIIKIFRSYNTKIQSHLSSLNQKAYILDYLFLSSQILVKDNDQTNKKIDVVELTLDTLFKDN
ncbi:hypothetical protein FG379_003440 [Cryptosporidium bovis]|uniref:uncharacterized protein n=1 Tax=Cryptosporidium bovis TaxID=310047 RepID=UPI00351A67B8|nr:hypothetical protein FG379_003440 [Cryptosporidium bovis]